ncbi:MAG: hypothetical protein EAZ85_10140 [Bacteroidetes bacterium]|nr:MAG: hypothetical protein EAZ85_10140 [Bacteroidota bacterium]TAG85423.1 MAG: hypothetical protein EAZ20_15170 [Bacteroidota bacterium]
MFINYILKLKQLLDDVYDYIDVKLELIKLDTEEKMTRVSILLLEIGLLVGIFIVFVLFGSIALGLYLNYIFQSWYLGFVLLAFGQLLTGLFLWITIKLFPQFWQRNTQKIFANIIKKIFKNK